MNLLSNAFKFTLSGSISLRLRQQESAAVLTVTDTGAGIPAAALPNLFERFYRVPGTQGRTHEGTGIGLALGAGTRQAPPRHDRGEQRIGPRALASRSRFRCSRPRPRRTPRRAAVPAPVSAHSFVRQAMRWISPNDTEPFAAEPGSQSPAEPAAPSLGPRHRAACRGQCRHARLYSAAARAALHDRHGTRWPGSARLSAQIPGRFAADRHHDAAPRRIFAAEPDPRRCRLAGTAGRAAVGARRRRGEDRGPGCRRGRLPGEAFFRARIAGPRHLPPVARESPPGGARSRPRGRPALARRARVIDIGFALLEEHALVRR
jgi:hypothetical protein